MKTFDVVIVGAGPAGSTAAFLLSRDGFETLLIDESRFPRHKLCGGLLTDKTLRLLTSLIGETPRSLTDHGVIDYRTSGYEIFAGDELLTVDTSDLPFHFVRRTTYDAFLLEKARAAGTAVIEGERITAIDPDGSEVVGSTGRRYRGKIIIGSDGVNSVVRRSFPRERFDGAGWGRNLGAALQLYVDRSDCEGSLRYLDSIRIYLDTADFGYSWVFPNRDRIVVGSGGLIRRNGDLKGSFQRYLGILGFAGPVPAGLFGHLIPCGGFMTRPAYRNVVLIGDSGGFADPVTGEGIYYAHMSARLAARSIQSALRTGGSIETIYPQLVMDQIIPELAWAAGLRRFAFGLIGPLKLRPLKPLAKRLERMLVEIINGRRSYRFLRRLEG